MNKSRVYNRYGYQGQFAEKDEETGWNHFELREYDPVIGRWLNIDPCGQFYSPYLGIGNIPTIGLDPTGGICPTCPDESVFDIYHQSNLLYEFNQLVSGDGVFQKLPEVIVLGDLTAHQRAMRNPLTQAVHAAQNAVADHPITQIIVFAATGVAGGGSLTATIGQELLKNTAFELGSQLIANRFDRQKAVSNADLFDIATGIRFSKVRGLALVTGAVDYTAKDGLTFLGGHGKYHKGLEKAISDGLIQAGVGSVSNSKPLLQEAILEVFGGAVSEKISNTWLEKKN